MTLWSWAFVVGLCVVVPVLSMRSMSIAEALQAGRITLYVNICGSLWILAAIGFLVVRLDGESLQDVLVRTDLPGATGWNLILSVVLLTGGGLGIFALSHIIGHRGGWTGESDLLDRLRPRTAIEQVWIVLVLSPTAGLCEEFLYRGVLLTRLEGLLGSTLAAGLVSSAAFGAAHLYQGRSGALRAATIGLLLAFPPMFQRTSIPSILAHALIDALAVLAVWPWLERVWPPAKSRRPPATPA